MRAFLAQLRESIYMDVSYAVACEGTPRVQAYVDAIRNHLSGLIGALVCKVRGHAWEDHSSIGPESGRECMHCKRCGASFSHTYY